MSYALAKPQTTAALTTVDADAPLDLDAESASLITRNDAWLVSFIDILILLLTLFVLLLTYQQDGRSADAGSRISSDSTTQADEPFELVLDLATLLTAPDGLEDIFNLNEEPAATRLLAEHERAPADPPASTETLPSAPVETPATTDEGTQVQARSTDGRTGGADQPATASQAAPPAAPEQTIDTAAAKPDPLQVFLQTFNEDKLLDRVEVSVHGAGVNLEISESILFPPASADLTSGGTAILRKLADALSAQSYPLSVEGHTDSTPIHTARYPSNWELSTARASTVARHLVKWGVSAERIRAIGYADTRPRAENLTPEGRSRNRRVSLVLQVPSVN
jgi:chemotaxis protein MotB